MRCRRHCKAGRQAAFSLTFPLAPPRAPPRRPACQQAGQQADRRSRRSLLLLQLQRAVRQPRQRGRLVRCLLRRAQRRAAAPAPAAALLAALLAQRRRLPCIHKGDGCKQRAETPITHWYLPNGRWLPVVVRARHAGSPTAQVRVRRSDRSMWVGWPAATILGLQRPCCHPACRTPSAGHQRARAGRAGLLRPGTEQDTWCSKNGAHGLAPATGAAPTGIHRVGSQALGEREAPGEGGG